MLYMNQHKWLCVLLFINTFIATNSLQGSHHYRKKDQSIIKQSERKKLIEETKIIDVNALHELEKSTKTVDEMYRTIISGNLDPQTFFNSAITYENLELANKLLNSCEIDISWALALACRFAMLDAVTLMLENDNMNQFVKKRALNTLVSGQDFPNHRTGAFRPLLFILKFYQKPFEKKSYPIMKLLLEQGADPSLESEDGQDAIDIARETGLSKDIIEILKEYMPKPKKK